MKLLITGATGRVGSQVLLQALADPGVTTVLALSRRPLNNEVSKNAKLTVLIVEDFKEYSNSVIESLADLDACIWCLGTPQADPLLEIDFPITFHETMLKVLSGTMRKSKFRYIHTSGKLVDQDQNKNHWILKSTRKTKGLAEKKFLDFAAEHSDIWQAWIVRPGGVINPQILGVGLITSLIGRNWSIRGDELGAFMVDLAVNGTESDTLVFQNEEMVAKGQELLLKRGS